MSLIEWDLPRTYPTLGECLCIWYDTFVLVHLAKRGAMSGRKMDLFRSLVVRNCEHVIFHTVRAGIFGAD